MATNGWHWGYTLISDPTARSFSTSSGAAAAGGEARAIFKDSTKRKERKGVIRMSDAEVALELLKLAMRTEPAASTNSEKFFELYRKCLAAVRESKA